MNASQAARLNLLEFCRRFALFSLSSELYSRLLLEIGPGDWQSEVRSVVEDVIKNADANGLSYEDQAKCIASALAVVYALFSRFKLD